MPDYSNGKIYALKSHNDTSLIYIGSTVQPLHKRHRAHRHKYKLYIDNKHHYVTSFKVIEKGNTYMELLESYDCNTKEELLKKEGEYMRSINCVNKCLAGRTTKQYYIDNKEIILNRSLEWNKNNREHRLKYMVEWRKNNKDNLYEKHLCVCGLTYTTTHKARHQRTKKHHKLFLQVIEQRIKEMEASLIEL